MELRLFNNHCLKDTFIRIQAFVPYPLFFVLLNQNTRKILRVGYNRVGRALVRVLTSPADRAIIFLSSHCLLFLGSGWIRCNPYFRPVQENGN